MIDLVNSNAKEIAGCFSHEVNTFTFRPDKIAEEQKNNREMLDLDVCWIKILSSPGYRTDLRNEASAKVGKQLAGIPFIKQKMDLVANPKMEAVAKSMALDHRTLQQTFSELVFYHLMLACNKEENQILSDTVGDSFFRLPLV